MLHYILTKKSFFFWREVFQIGKVRKIPRKNITYNTYKSLIICILYDSVSFLSIAFIKVENTEIRPYEIQKKWGKRVIGIGVSFDPEKRDIGG